MMKSRLRYAASALMWAAILITAYAVIAQTSSSAKKNNSPASGNRQSITQAAGPSLPVQGNGTLGRLPKGRNILNGCANSNSDASRLSKRDSHASRLESSRLSLPAI
jgi:hypothetical protein